MRDRYETRYDPRLDAPGDADERNRMGPGRAVRHWAMTTADERRNRALSAAFNRSRPRDFRPFLATLVGFFGLVFVAIGGALLFAGLGGAAAVVPAVELAFRTAVAEVARFNLPSHLVWGGVVLALALLGWLLYLGRRVIYALLIVALVALFALGVVGSVTVARDLAALFAEKT